MKRLIIASAMLFTMLLTTPVWSHHPAEGIVSDDIWQMVDALLVEAESPHLNIDFDDVMDSMRVVTDLDGNLLLATSFVVETAALDDYLVWISDVLDVVNRIPSGVTDSGTASILTVGTEPLEGGMTEITIYEPVGQGRSQDGLDPKNGGMQAPAAPGMN